MDYAIHSSVSDWIGIGALVAVGVGIMMSVRSGKPTVTEEVDR
jgi:hypothetical protein